MNDDDPKPGVVIDVEPEPEQPGASPDETSSQDDAAPAADKRTAPPRWPLALGGLALLVAVAVGGGGYYLVEQLGSRVAGLERSIDDERGTRTSLQQELAGLATSLEQQVGTLEQQEAVLEQQSLAVEEARAAFIDQEQRLANENVRLQEREAELRAAVADVHRRVGRSGTQWIIAEAEYLLRIANHRLTLARDTNTAQAALELADQRLRDTQDPGWAGVRAQIARDIAHLATFDQPDLAGLSARLAALIEQVPQLEIDRATIGPERTLPERVARDPEERSWDTLLDDLWAGFKDSVRIRERDQPVAAMLAPEHQFFLYENLKLHLESARLGLARGDRALFDDHLATAADWIARHFKADAVASSLSEAIASIRATDIEPELPDISQSLRALTVRQELIDSLPDTETAAAEAAAGVETP
jgi:uroporphyrin-3 C-methyltransferase